MTRVSHEESIGVCRRTNCWRTLGGAGGFVETDCSVRNTRPPLHCSQGRLLQLVALRDVAAPEVRQDLGWEGARALGRTPRAPQEYPNGVRCRTPAVWKPQAALAPLRRRDSSGPLPLKDC